MKFYLLFIVFLGIFLFGCGDSQTNEDGSLLSSRSQTTLSVDSENHPRENPLFASFRAKQTYWSGEADRLKQARSDTCENSADTVSTRDDTEAGLEKFQKCTELKEQINNALAILSDCENALDALGEVDAAHGCLTSR